MSRCEDPVEDSIPSTSWVSIISHWHQHWCVSLCIKVEWLRLTSTDFSDTYRNKHTNCIAWSTMDAMDKPLDAAPEARKNGRSWRCFSVKNGDFYHLKLGFHHKWRLYYETWWWNNKKCGFHHEFEWSSPWHACWHVFWHVQCDSIFVVHCTWYKVGAPRPNRRKYVQ